MTTLQSLQAKIASVTSATQLSNILTDSERALLGTGLRLLQPLPWLKTATGETRYFGIDHLGAGSLLSVNCPPAAFVESYGNLRIAEDFEILIGLVAQEAELG